MFYWKLRDRFLKVSGPDAARFLHGLLTCEVKNLPLGKITAYALLSPQGRLLSFGHLLRSAEQDYVLSVPEEVFAATAALLERYLISDRAVISETQDFKRSYLCLESADPEPFDPAKVKAEPVDFVEGAFSPHHGFLRATCLWSSSEKDFGASELALRDFEAWRIRSGFPLWGQDILSDSLAIELPIEHAISFKKGCYMGQEVVAKGTIRGRPPRYLVRIEADGVLKERAVVDEQGLEVGVLTSVFDRWGLALVRRPALESSSGVLLSSGQALRWSRLTHWSLAPATP